jgi:cell division protein FtsB
MWTQQKKRSRKDAFIVPFLCLMVSAYFLHHSFDGRFGSISLARMQASVAEETSKLEALKAERASLEHHVALLRSGSIERDTLDEHARGKLGLIGAHDVVIATGG